MDDVAAALASLRGGFFFRRDALDAGFDDRSLRHGVRSGHLLRLRHGTYAPLKAWEERTPRERHMLLARSVLARLGPNAVLSHDTAAFIHTGVDWGLDLSNIHVTRLDPPRARSEAGVVSHHGHTPPDDIVEVDGLPLIRPSRALLETASLHRVDVGMAQLSIGLRLGATDPDELHAAMERMQQWRGMNTVRLAVGWADPRCENVAEIRSMYVFRRFGVPLPVPQVRIFAASGRLIARVDFDWARFRHVGEVDGQAKYAQFAQPGQPASVLIDEKWREDEVRDTMRGVSRWGWKHFDAPRILAARITHDLERSARVYGMYI